MLTRCGVAVASSSVNSLRSPRGLRLVLTVALSVRCRSLSRRRGRLHRWSGLPLPSIHRSIGRSIRSRCRSMCLVRDRAAGDPRKCAGPRFVERDQSVELSCASVARNGRPGYERIDNCLPNTCLRIPASGYYSSNATALAVAEHCQLHRHSSCSARRVTSSQPLGGPIGEVAKRFRVAQTHPHPRHTRIKGPVDEYVAPDRAG